jgi:hypothetical protein
VASGADGLAGLSAVIGGGGAVAQPAKRKAINGIEYRFIICLGDRFQKLELEFHSAEIRNVLLDRQPGRCRDAGTENCNDKSQSRERNSGFRPSDRHDEAGKGQCSQKIENTNCLFGAIHVLVERFGAGIIGHATDRLVRSLSGHQDGVC